MSATEPEDNSTNSAAVTAASGRPQIASTQKDPPLDKKMQRVGADWVKNNQALGIGVAFVLLAFYMAPIFLIAAAAWYTDGFNEPNFLLSWFAFFVQSADSTLNQFHKILLPVISAISVIAFKGRPTTGMISLGAFILLAFVLTIFMSVVFDMPGTAVSIHGLEGLTAFDPSGAKHFFTRIEETLMMYLMMLIGINISNASK